MEGIEKYQVPEDRMSRSIIIFYILAPFLSFPFISLIFSSPLHSLNVLSLILSSPLVSLSIPYNKKEIEKKRIEKN